MQNATFSDERTAFLSPASSAAACSFTAQCIHLMSNACAENTPSPRVAAAAQSSSGQKNEPCGTCKGVKNAR